MTVILKALTSIGLVLLSEAMIKEFIIWLAEKVANSTKTTIDNEFVEMVKRHLGRGI